MAILTFKELPTDIKRGRKRQTDKQKVGKT